MSKISPKGINYHYLFPADKEKGLANSPVGETEYYEEN
jgi:hypothetical protein